MTGIRRIPLVLALAAAVAAGPWAGARAQETPPAAPPAPQEARPERPGLLGLMLHLGAYTGTGGGVQVGSRRLGLRLSVGWAPVLLVLGRPNQDPKIEFYSTLLAAPDLYVAFTGPQSAAEAGAQLGYRYSTLLGSGGAAGAYVRFPLGRVDGLVNGGVLFFPSGEDKIKNKEKLPSGTSFFFPGPNVNIGISLGLLFLP
jgi:hypothetical protein